MAIGYSEATANQVTELLFAELDWEDQFETGKPQAESWKSSLSAGTEELSLI